MSESNGHVERVEKQAKLPVGIMGCPFCGHTNLLTIEPAAIDEHFNVVCRFCRAGGPPVRDDSDLLLSEDQKPKRPLVEWSRWNSVAEAVQAWNKRKASKIGDNRRFPRNSLHVAACPFCGHTNCLSISYARPVHRPQLQVECNYCGAHGPRREDGKPKEKDGRDNIWHSSWNSIEDTLGAWNSRVKAKTFSPTVD